ncbi:MAG: hypothetical protein ACE5DS_01765 [Kiloniellaceae bacterium]
MDQLVSRFVPGVGEAAEAHAPSERIPESKVPLWAQSVADDWYVPPDPPPTPRRKPTRLAEARPLSAPAGRGLDPALLVGLDFAATKALLGDPVLQLEQPPAKVWAYNGGICMFNVFFYPSMDDNVFRVLTYAATDGDTSGLVPAARGMEAETTKNRGHDNPVLQRCFAELFHDRESQDASYQDAG